MDPPPPPTSDPTPPAGAYPPPGQVCPPPQVQGHNQVPYVVPPPVACPMKNNEPEGDPQGPQQSAPFLHRRSEDGFWTECGSTMFWCLLCDLSLFRNCVTNIILNPRPKKEDTLLNNVC